ncbi:MAG: hypothetical protein H6822_01995 [Planctomycetaceae bacterium]|nr:hypothetical protein [Planctomycetales bacterium]MCB9920921.1 hypothetical protein [Planctomycetaceae bacterium]
MTSNDKPIRLDAHDDGLLRNLYVQLGIPRDQYKKRPEDMNVLERMWVNLSGRNDSAPELIRYMQNQQKAKRRLKVPWPVFNGAHKRAPSLSSALDGEQMESLKSAYEAVVLPLDVGTDAAAWNEEAVESLAREFSRLTGMIMPGLILLAIAEEKRKRGVWFKVGRRRSEGFDFGSLDDVEDL